MRDALRHLQAGSGGIAGTDDADSGQRERRTMAAHGQERRRIIDHLQPLWIFVFTDRDEGGFELVGGFEFPLCLFA
jgi:hypothetical protein